MKRKAIKITESTLFVYKKEKNQAARSESDPTTTTVTMCVTGKSGIFSNHRSFK